jgi:hypothetical protein
MKSIHQSLKTSRFEPTTKSGIVAKQGRVNTPTQSLSPKEARELSLRLLAAAIEAEEQ